MHEPVHPKWEEWNAEQLLTVAFTVLLVCMKSDEEFIFTKGSYSCYPYFSLVCKLLGIHTWICLLITASWKQSQFTEFLSF